MTVADRPLSGKLTTPTRRDFIRGIAAAGASTARRGRARARRGSTCSPTRRSARRRPQRVRRLPGDRRPSRPTRWRCPGIPRRRPDLVGRRLPRQGPARYRYGFNNDFLAFFPLEGRTRGCCSSTTSTRTRSSCTATSPNGSAKTAGAGAGGAGRRRQLDPPHQAQPRRRMEGRLAVGLQPAHLRRPAGPRVHRAAARRDGDRHQRATDRSATAPAASRRGAPPSRARRTSTATGRTSRPTSTSPTAGTSTAASPRTPSTSSTPSRSTAGCASTTPTTPARWAASTPRSGRFRHENTAFRHVPGSKFVLYMGDDKNNEGVYKFVSDRSSSPSDSSNNRRILEAGHALHRALGARGPAPVRDGRRHRRRSRRPRARARGSRCPRTRSTTRRPSCAADTAPTSTTRTSRPTGPRTSRWPRTAPCYIALTNNTHGEFDSHGSVRRLREKRQRPGGARVHVARLRGRRADGTRAAARAASRAPTTSCSTRPTTSGWSPTSRRAGSTGTNEYEYHANNAMFLVPTRARTRASRSGSPTAR